jgi:hypothetical protein
MKSQPSQCCAEGFASDNAAFVDNGSKTVM